MPTIISMPSKFLSPIIILSSYYISEKGNNREFRGNQGDIQGHSVPTYSSSAFCRYFWGLGRTPNKREASTAISRYPACEVTISLLPHSLLLLIAYPLKHKYYHILTGQPFAPIKDPAPYLQANISKSLYKKLSNMRSQSPEAFAYIVEALRII